MSSMFFVTLWLAIGAQTPAPAPSVTADDRLPRLEVVLQRVRTDGQPTASVSAGASSSFERVVWIDASCNLTTGDREPSSASGGWRFSVAIVQRAGGVIDGTITWHRLSNRGARAGDSPSGNIQRTFQVGERIALDRIDGLDVCGASSLQLEATATRATQSGSGGFRGGRGAGRGAGGGTAAPAGRGGTTAQTGRGGTPDRAATPAGRSTTMGGRGAGRGAGGGVGVRGEPTPAGAAAFGRGRFFGTQGPSFSAELWLVHRPPTPAGGAAEATPAGAGRGGRAARGSVTALPSGDRMVLRLDGAETTLRAAHRFQASGTGFAFPALSIDTARGVVVVIVTGTMSVRLRDGAPAALVVTIRRQTTTPDSGPVAEGTTGPQEIAWEKAREVVSFELPAPSGGAADPLAGHRLELRLRVTGQ